MKTSPKHDKGVAGLTILLSVIVMIFIIGLITMIFVLMNARLQNSDALYTTSDSLAVANESLTTVEETGESLSVAGLRDVVCTISTVINASGGAAITAGNYTQTNCLLQADGASNGYNNSNWNVSYSYINEVDTGAADVANDSSTGFSGVVDWFSLFIVIAAMVVLILLTVVIISAIKGGGLMGAGSTKSAKRVGTA